MKLPTLSLTLFFFPLSFSLYDLEHDDVKVYPFFTLSSLHKSMHVILDEFKLIQIIDLSPIVLHMEQIASTFTKASQSFKTTNSSYDWNIADSEQKVTALLNQLAESVQTGIQFLPHAKSCVNRKKRTAIPDIDEEVVNTHPLFPQVGNLFQWVTGTLSSDAGRYINENFNNIRRLTQSSKNFAHMFNQTLKIEQKHKQQLHELKDRVEQLQLTLSNEVNTVDRKISYLQFLNNINLILMDLIRTVDLIFLHTDDAELNKMGPLARDSAFLKTVHDLMNPTKVNKRNILYLMKISATVNMQACHHHITITYKFPILNPHDFNPKKVISIPKKINGKYFQLAKLPYVVAFADNVYSFSQEEFSNCKTYNKNIFCKRPSNIKHFLHSCIHSIMSKLPWTNITDLCPLHFTPNPDDFFQFTQTHMIYFTKKTMFATIICPNNFEVGKTVTLEGAGLIQLPNGCKVKYAETESHIIGHVARTAKIKVDMRHEVFDINFSNLLNTMNVQNVANISSLWEDTDEEEQVIKQGIEESLNILNNIQFTPSGVTITLLSLIGYTVIATLAIFLGLYLVCFPSSVRKCKSCCCICRSKKPNVVDASMV